MSTLEILFIIYISITTIGWILSHKERFEARRFENDIFKRDKLINNYSEEIEKLNQILDNERERISELQIMFYKKLSKEGFTKITSQLDVSGNTYFIFEKEGSYEKA